ncbi:MAG TPA: DUF2177 family protein [bacterium]|nr:DUF2177 family protein [bacterium]
MNILYYLKYYFTALIIFLGIDMIWLSKIAPKFYQQHIGHLLADKPNLLPAVVFYLFNIIGILIFSVFPGVANNSLKTTALMAALYGALTYATYDLTNMATMKQWPLIVTIVDIIWGSLLTTAVAVLTYLILHRNV